MGDDLSTTADLHERPPTRAARLLERLGIATVAAIVVAAAVGFAGPTTATTSASAPGWQLTVTYPRITRAGMPAPLQVEIHREGGFDGPVTVTVCTGLLEDSDFQNWYPNPASETSGPDRVVYEFDPPDGDVLAVSLDARTAPGQFGAVDDCFVTVRSAGIDLVGADFTVWRLP